MENSHPNFKTYYKATIMKNGMRIDQWDRTESSDINIYGQLIFDKDAKRTQ